MERYYEGGPRPPLAHKNTTTGWVYENPPPGIDIATRVQNAKFLYEMGRKDDESEKLLKQSFFKDTPDNWTVPYYLDLIKEARYMDYARRRESMARDFHRQSRGNADPVHQPGGAAGLPNRMWDTNWSIPPKGGNGFFPSSTPSR